MAGVLLYAFNASDPQSGGQNEGMENWTVSISASEDNETSFNYTSLPADRIGILRIIKDTTSTDVNDFESGTTWVYCPSCNLSESTYTVFYQTPFPRPSPSPTSSPSPSPSETPSASPEPSASPSVSPSPSVEANASIPLIKIVRPDGSEVPFDFQFDANAKRARSLNINPIIQEISLVNPAPVEVQAAEPAVVGNATQEKARQEKAAIIGFDELEDLSSVVSPPGVFFTNVFAIDLSKAKFDFASFTFVSTGEAVWKCKNWVFNERVCKDNVWEKWIDTTPGRLYTLGLTPDDPGIALSGRNTAMMVYENTTPTVDIPKYRLWTGTSTAWGSGLTALSLGASSTINWVELRASPTKDEYLMVVVTNDSKIIAQVYRNGVWGNQTTLTTGTSSIEEGVGVEYMQSSGDAVVVWNNASTRDPYIIWNGTTATWGTQSQVAADSCITAGNWMYLFPRYGTNELILMLMDNAARLCAQHWSGSSWDSVTNLENTTETFANLGRAFGGAFEYTSGKAIVVWESLTGSGTVGNIRFANWTGSSWSSAAAASGDVGSGNDWIRCDSQKSEGSQASNIIVCDAYEDVGAAESDDLNVGQWNGSQGIWTLGGASAWLAYDTAIEDDTVDGDEADIKFIGNTNTTMLVYIDATTAFPTYRTCNTGTNCDATGDFATLTGGAQCGEAADGAFPQIAPDPFSNDSLIGWVSLTSWNKCTIFYNGTTNAIGSQATLLGGGRVAVSGGDANGFSIAFKQLNQPPWHNGTNASSYPGPNWYSSTGINATAMPTGSEQRVFSSFWSDDVALSSYTLEWNQSGSFVNQTWTAFSDYNSTWGNYTITVAASDEGRTLRGRIWANDSRNLFNSSGYVNLQVYNVNPVVTNAQQNTSPGNSTDINTLICFNSTVTDVGAGVDKSWVETTFPNGTVLNLTLQSADIDCTNGAATAYGREVHVGSTAGTLTFNKSWANDTRANIAFDTAHVTLNVTITTPAASLKIANFRLWEDSSTMIGNYTNETTALKCNTTSSFGVNIANSPGGVSCNNTAPSKSYRAEIRLCNDGASGASSATFDYVNHRLLSSQYLGSLTLNDCGHGDNGSAWNATNCNSYTESGLNTIQIQNESGSDKHFLPSGDGSTRTDTTCEYYAYRFTTGAPDWVITDNSFINTSGVTSGSNPALLNNLNLNVTYSETAFALFYPSSGCTAGSGSEGRTRPKYYNESCTIGGAHACDPQNATYQNWNDTTTRANVSVTVGSADKIYYNFTDISSIQGAFYWTLNTNSVSDTLELHIWNWATSNWNLLDKRSTTTVETRVTPLAGNSSNYISSGMINVSFNASTAAASGTSFLYDFYYEGNHSSKCVRCYFTSTNPNAKSLACEGQSGYGASGTAFFDLQNLGSIIEAWKVYVSNPQPGGITMFLNDSSGTSVTLSGTQQTFNSSVEIYEHAYAWAWTNFSGFRGTNENQLVSNTSTS